MLMIPVGDSVLPPQFEYSAKTAEVEVVDSACWPRVHRPSLCSIQQSRKDDGLVHLQVRTETETITIPNCALKAAEGLISLRNPAGEFDVDFRAAGEVTAQVREVVYYLPLGSVHANLWHVVGRGYVGRRLVHDHRLLRVDDQSEVRAGGGEEAHASLHVLFRGGVEDVVVSEEKFLNGGCVYARLEVHPSLIQQVTVCPVGDAYPGVFVAAVLLGEQAADGDVDIVEPVLALAACATEGDQRRRLERVSQLASSVLHGDVLVSGGNNDCEVV
ncbi:hypothetical protein SprV_0301130500 [Sparganum proliferum]